MTNILGTKELAEKLNCCAETVKVYMSRAEFSHVKYFKIRNKIVYEGLESKDFKLLRKFIEKGKLKRFGKLPKIK